MMNHGKSMIDSKLSFVCSTASEPLKQALPKDIEDRNSEKPKGRSNSRMDQSKTEMASNGVFPNSVIPQVVISNDLSVVQCWIST